MSKRAKQKRTSPYRCRSIDPLGGLSILSTRYGGEHAPMAADQITDLGVSYWVTFANMATGASTEYDWTTVTCALNLGMVMAENGLGEEHIDIFNRALDGAFRAKIRGEKTGIWRYDGEALNTIRTALELHDQQCQLTTQAEMLNTIRIVHQRLEAGHVYQVEKISAETTN